jgi:zeaxanthin glucosyltransferase
MANIVIAPLYWHADLNATFALARKLQDRGHHVHYICIPEMEERIRSQGFDFLPVFSSVFPPGTLATQYAKEAAGKYLGVAGINTRVKGMCELCRDGEVARATAHLKPDLFLVSNHMPWEAIDAWKTGVPVIMFSHLVVSVPDSRVPPISSHTIPSSSFTSRLKVLWEWQKVKLRGKLVGKVSGLSKISSYIADLAAATGYPVSDIDFDALPWPRLPLPELVFFPECFDFRRATPVNGAFYIEPSIDTARKDKEFPWEQLDGRPLVFCSLGSLVTFKYLALAKRLFQQLLDAVKQRPDLQAVVAIGSYLAAEEFDCPENTILVDEAPQVALLRRAKVMVGHAGSGCIRESIFFGVPMILLDAPGNTARAIYHGLALKADFRTVTTQDFKAGLEKLLGVPAYSEAAKRMSREFTNLENQSPSISIIEKALSGELNLHQSAQEMVPLASR